MTLLAYIMLGLAVILAVLVLGLAMTQPAQAQETTGTASTYQEAYKPWAAKWAKIAKRERAKLVKVTDALSMKRPRPLPIPAQFTAIQVDVTTGVEVVVVQWKDFGQKAKDTSRWYAARRAQLWQRMTHPKGSGAARWLPAAKYVGWPRNTWSMLVVCIRRESGGNPKLISRTGDVGLMQINWVHHQPTAKMQDPIENLRFALKLYRGHLRKYGNGWLPWCALRGIAW